MKGYTIQHSIDLLEKAVEDGGGSGPVSVTAADVSYDNTSSHLTADDVQEAIDEINTAIGSIDTGVHYSTTEQVIGKWLDNRDIYQLSYVIASDVTISHESFTNLTALATPENIDTIVDSEVIRIGNHGPLSHDCAVMTSGDDVYIALRNSSGYDLALATGSTLTIRYIKTAPVSSTRSKKK